MTDLHARGYRCGNFSGDLGLKFRGRAPLSTINFTYGCWMKVAADYRLKPIPFSRFHFSLTEIAKLYGRHIILNQCSCSIHRYHIAQPLIHRHRSHLPLHREHTIRKHNKFKPARLNLYAMQNRRQNNLHRRASPISQRLLSPQENA